MTNWRYGIVIGFLVATFMGLTLLSTVVTRPPSNAEETITNRSVFNAKPSGYRAWHATLEKAGVETVVWRNGFDALDELPPGALMVIIEPYTVAGTDVVFGEEQALALLDWVAQGNDVVLIDDFRRTGAKVILSELDVYLQKDKKTGKKNKTDKNKPVFYEINPLNSPFVFRKVLTEVPTRFNLAKMPTGKKTSYQSSALFHADNPAMATLQHGDGVITLTTLVDIADNSFLQNAEVDNYQLLTNIVLQAAKGRPIAINEYVHGYTRVGDLLAYYQKKTPLGKMLTQLLLVFLVMLWLSFTPWKPKVSLREERQDISLSAFIASMAGIYYRTRSASIVLAPRLHDIERTLRKRYRMGLGETKRVGALLENLFAPTAIRGYSDGAELARALEKARQVAARRQNLPHPELLKLSRQLSLIQDTLQHGSRTKN